MSVFIEEKQQFSKSVLWAAQREYYDTEGIDAWTEDVPFYVTSNPFIAHTYAHVAIRFIQDWVRKDPSSIQEPFYFLELGTGPGQFSYYLLKTLTEIQNKLGMQDIKLRYVMSDFTEKNIEFWMQHERLRPFVERRVLDFAQLDLENDDQIRLRHSGVSLSQHSMKNPLIVVANYIFDTLRTDIFTVKNDTLYESLVSLKTSKGNFKGNKPKDWEKVDVNHSAIEVTNGYYDDEHYNDVLRAYSDALKETHFLFPIATLDALKRLKAISNDTMLVLSSDKAYSTLEEQDELDYPELAFHGSFSVMANFDAIARVFKSSGGDAVLQTPREGITTAVFACGVEFSNFPETSLALEEYIEGFSPGDYFLLHDQVCNEDKDVKLEVYAALLSMSCWDPYVYTLVLDRVVELLDEVDCDTLEYLSHNMHKIAENFYFIPGTDDVLFNVGLFFHEAEKYDEAIPYYKESITVFGEQHVTLYNLAICYYEIGQLKKALSLFKESIKKDPKQKDAKEWVKTIEKELKKK